MTRLLALPAFLVATVASFIFWWALGRPVDVANLPGGRFDCLSYTPWEGSASPLDPDYTVSTERIRADLRILSRYTDCVRTYSSLGPQGVVVREAAALDMEVLLGIWIGSKEDLNRKEIEAALALARDHPDAVRMLVVGNEVLLRRELTGDALAALIRRVRNRARHPVTYADIPHFWTRNPQVAEAVDVIAIHILPHWDDPAPVGIDTVQDHVSAIFDRVRKTFPDKEIIIGEIGWPSAGRTRAAAAPGLVNQARFLREFAAQAREKGLRYNIIEGLDQPWKRANEGTVGGYWGVLDRDRELKFPLDGPVSAFPEWRSHFVVAGATSLVVLAWGFFVSRRLSFHRWLALAVISQTLGSTFAFQIDAFRTTTMGILDGALGVGAMALTVAATVLMLRIILGGDSVWSSARAATLSQITAWLRRGRRRRPPAAVVIGLMRWAAAFPAAVVCLAMAIDPRHRDFPLAYLWLPTAVLLVRFLLARRRAQTTERPSDEAPASDGREEAWVGLVLLVAGLFALDGPDNVEAMAWTAIATALALPWLPFVRFELLHLRLALAQPRRPQES